MNKLGITNRLAQLGLRKVAEAYREEVRPRLKVKSKTRDEASLAAWTEMWKLFEPVCEMWEKEREGRPDGETPLLGCADDLDQFLDPTYSETDPGKWLRDGLLWTAAEIRRVVRDSAEGTSVDLARAKIPPPTPWAVFCLEEFARKPPSKRGDLIARVMPFATKQHDPTEPPAPEGGFLDEIDS